METEKEKLIRAYRQGVKDGAATMFLLVNRGELTMEEMREELESFRIENAEGAVAEIMGELPGDPLLN